MSNAGASRIALEYGIVGPSYTVSTRLRFQPATPIGQAF
jgi:hypothetical protein